MNYSENRTVRTIGKQTPVPKDNGLGLSPQGSANLQAKGYPHRCGWGSQIDDQEGDGEDVLTNKIGVYGW